MERVLILLACGLVWLFVNIKAGESWLKLVSIVCSLAFLAAASWVALQTVGVLP